MVYMKVVKPSGVDIVEVSPHTQLSSSSTLSLSLLAELRWIQYLSSKISAFTKTNDEWKVFPFHHHFHSWNFNFILSTPRLASSRAPFGCFTLRHNANIIPFPCRWQWQPRHDFSLSFPSLDTTSKKWKPLNNYLRWDEDDNRENNLFMRCFKVTGKSISLLTAKCCGMDFFCAPSRHSGRVSETEKIFMASLREERKKRKVSLMAVNEWVEQDWQHRWVSILSCAREGGNWEDGGKLQLSL